MRYKWQDTSKLNIRLSRRLGRLGVGLALVVIASCRPDNQKMLVAYVQGDVFQPHLTAGVWEIGETKRCEIASPIPTDQENLLVCGVQTQFAWSQTWLRPDIRAQIYNATKEMLVTFLGQGHYGRNYHRWDCERTISGI